MDPAKTNQDIFVARCNADIIMNELKILLELSAK